MPYANSHGIKIHYQVVGKGAPLVLLHGLYGSWVDWYDSGYVQALQEQYQLLLVDGRGHGASDKPHEPEAYAMPYMVQDIVAVLDTVQASKAHFLGYSWGGCIGFGLAQYAPERFKSMIIGGYAPSPGDPQIVSAFIEYLRGGVASFSVLLDQIFGTSLSPYKSLRLAGDFDAYIAATEAWRDYSGFEAGLSKLTMPSLHYMGEADEGLPLIQDSIHKIPRGTLIPLAGLDHTQGFLRSDLVLPHIIKFLRDVE